MKEFSTSFPQMDKKFLHWRKWRLQEPGIEILQFEVLWWPMMMDEVIFNCFYVNQEHYDVKILRVPLFRFIR